MYVVTVARLRKASKFRAIRQYGGPFSGAATPHALLKFDLEKPEPLNKLLDARNMPQQRVGRILQRDSDVGQAAQGHEAAHIAEYLIGTLHPQTLFLVHVWNTFRARNGTKRPCLGHFAQPKMLREHGRARAFASTIRQCRMDITHRVRGKKISEQYGAGRLAEIQPQ